MTRPAIAGLAALAAAAVALGAVIWLVIAGVPASGSGEAAAQQESGFTLDEARAFADFPLYWVGEEYRGLSLEEVDRMQGSPPPGKIGYPQDFVSFVYDDGRCPPTPLPWIDPEEDWSCAEPLEIRIDRGCLYPPGLLGPEGLAELAERRGALVLERPGDMRVWSGDVLISISVNIEGVSPAQVLDDLVALDPGGPGPGEPLPAYGAVESITPLDDNQVFHAGGACG